MSQAFGRALDHIRLIDPELLHQHLASGRRVTIVDVREVDRFRGCSGHLPGSRCMPLEHLEARHTELSGLEARPLVLVSNHGMRARAAAALLEANGFTEVSCLEGGLRRWIELGFPTECSIFPPAHSPMSSPR